MSGVKTNGDTRVILARMDERFTRVDDKFDALTSKVDEMHSKMDNFCDRLIVNEQKLESHTKEHHGTLDMIFGIGAVLGGMVGGFLGRIFK